MLKRLLSPLFVAAFIVLSLQISVSPATAAKSGASVFLQGIADEAVAVLSDQNISAESRQRAFRNLVKRGFDLPSVGRFVLGRYWRRANDAERAEFLRLFEDYIVVTYSRRLGSYSGEALQVTGERNLNATNEDLRAVDASLAQNREVQELQEERAKNEERKLQAAGELEKAEGELSKIIAEDGFSLFTKELDEAMLEGACNL